jgi:hypothetical protein
MATAQLAEMTVPIRGDLAPLRADLAAARRELEAFNASIGKGASSGSGASSTIAQMKKELSAANDNAVKLGASLGNVGTKAAREFQLANDNVRQVGTSLNMIAGSATGSFGKVWSGVTQLKGATEVAKQEFDQLAASVKNAGDQVRDMPKVVPPVTDNLNQAAKASKNLAWQQRNLSFQLIDTTQSLALGMPFYQVLLQQGPQIAQIWGPGEGGVGRAFSETGKMIGGLIAKNPIATAGLLLLGGTILKMRSDLKAAGNDAITFGDILTGLWKTVSEGVSDAFSPLMDTLKPVFEWIVDAVHSTGNLIIKSFLDVYNDLKYIFAQLPLTIALGIAKATNMVIDGVNSMIDYVIGGINKLTTAINGMLSKIPGYDASQDGLGMLDPKNLQITDRANTDGLVGQMNANLDARNKRHADIESGDPLGDFYDAWKENSVEAMKDRLAKKKKKGAREKEDPYEKIIRDSKQFIEQQNLEADAIGKTEEAAAAMRYEQEMLNKAADAHIKLTQAQKAEIHGLAEEMAAAEQKTKDLQAAYDFGKDVFKGFFTDLKDGLENGKSIWESFGNAVMNVLNKIADKLLDSALDSLFNGLWNSGGGGGGFLGGILGWITGGHATGTQYSPGGWKMVGEQGPELMKVPGGAQVIPNNRITAPTMPSFGGYNGGSSAPNIHVTVVGPNGDKQIRDMVDQGVQDGLDEYDTHRLPQSVERVRDNPRMR